MTALNYHEESRGQVPGPAERVFEWLDDPRRLSMHMSRSSWRMGGGRMLTTLDEGRGQRVGSHIRVSGRVFGITIGLDEVVTDRTPPHRKRRETAGSPRLLVTGAYRIGFELTARDGESALQVFIDYALPERWPSRWLGRLLGRSYARWCTSRMVNDAVAAFVATPVPRLDGTT